MRKHMTKLVALVALMVIAWASQVQAQKVTHPNPGPAGSWRLIGQTTANFGVDHDKIIVRGPYDNFRKIKFKVTGAGLNMLYMMVTYDNGAPDRIDVRQNIRQGGESRAIDLRGVGKRSLRSVEYWYDTKGVLKGKAQVTLFGMK